MLHTLQKKEGIWYALYEKNTITKGVEQNISGHTFSAQILGVFVELLCLRGSPAPALDQEASLGTDQTIPNVAHSRTTTDQWDILPALTGLPANTFASRPVLFNITIVRKRFAKLGFCDVQKTSN